MKDVGQFFWADADGEDDELWCEHKGASSEQEAKVDTPLAKQVAHNKGGASSKAQN